MKPVFQFPTICSPDEPYIEILKLSSIMMALFLEFGITGSYGVINFPREISKSF